MDACETAGFPLVTLTTLSVHDLKRRLDRGEKLTVLDVRTESEWNAGHIDGGLHIHGGKLQEHFEEVPRDQPVAVVCGSGYRASIAAFSVPGWWWSLPAFDPGDVSAAASV